MRELSEPLLREVNRRIHTLTRAFDGPSEFVCECGQATCHATTVSLDATEFADVLATPDVLIIAPGHDLPEMNIVRHRRGYLLVRY